MATKIVMGMDAIGKDGAREILVSENFDEVLEKYWPLQQPGSTLEGRTNALFTTLDGKRVLIKIPSIVLIEEDAE